MSAIAGIKLSVVVEDATGTRINYSPVLPVRFAPGAGSVGKQETVLLTASVYTAFTIPSGAKALIIFPGQSVSLTLKGVAGDQGWPIAPATNPTGLPILTSLASATSIGILNGSTSTQTIDLLWL